MNRRIARAASITLAGLAVLFPATSALADPSVSISVEGQPFSSGGSSSLGQSVHITGTACTNPDGPAYMGEFVIPGDDPWTAPSWHVYETPSDEAGSFTWDVVIPLDQGTGVFGSRWYCATAPVESLDDPAVQWVGPLVNMDIQPSGGGSTLLRSASLATTSKTTKTTKATTKKVATKLVGDSTGGVTITVDPDGLPAVDRVNLPGDVAAALKARVDALVSQRKKGGVYGPTNNSVYVTTAYQELTGKVPGMKKRQAMIDRLDAGDIRVAVIEDIALSAHSAAWWIQHS
jgi:hypothetical protein